jgi:phosphoserine phosphatase
LTPGARELVEATLVGGHEIALVSGGFQVIIEPIATQLGINYVRANELQVHKGQLTGQVVGQIIDRKAKAAALREFAQAAAVDLANTVAIGDGANDIDMLNAAGLGIAFNAQPALRDIAQAHIDTPRLDAALPLMGL